MLNVSERLRKRVLQELLWVKRKFVHRIGFLRTRTRWLIEAVRGNLQTNGLNRCTRPLRVRVRVPFH